MDREENGEENAPLELADSNLKKGDNWEALRLYLEVLEEEPDNAYAINKAGVAYARMGELEHAEQCFYDAVVLDPKLPAALSNLGNIFLNKGENDIAIALYSKALKYDPDYSVAHNNIAAAYKRVGQIDKHVSHFKRSQKIKVFGRDRHGIGTRGDDEETPARGRVGGGFWRRFGCLGGILVILAIPMLFAIL